jgi:hypothetical protein
MTLASFVVCVGVTPINTLRPVNRHITRDGFTIVTERDRNNLFRLRFWLIDTQEFHAVVRLRFGDNRIVLVGIR